MDGLVIIMAGPVLVVPVLGDGAVGVPVGVDPWNPPRCAVRFIGVTTEGLTSFAVACGLAHAAAMAIVLLAAFCCCYRYIGIVDVQQMTYVI